MHVLLLSHNYVHEAPRAKLKLLSPFEDLYLTVVVSHHWTFKPRGCVDAVDSYLDKYKFRTLPT